MHVFSYDYCEVFKNTYFEEYLPRAAFDLYRKCINNVSQLQYSIFYQRVGQM